MLISTADSIFRVGNCQSDKRIVGPQKENILILWAVTIPYAQGRFDLATGYKCNKNKIVCIDSFLLRRCKHNLVYNTGQYSFFIFF